nr:MAG TPA: tail component [Caudoviricetes sp.]
MSIAAHQRPGVYSSYDASSVVSGNSAGRLVGLVGVNTVAQAGVAQTITSYDQAVAAFGSNGCEDMAGLIRLALRNGASGVVSIPIENSEGYETAFEQLAGMEDIALVICDSTQEEVQQKLKASVVAASDRRRERLAVLAGAASEGADALIQRAKNLNCERLLLVAPGGVNSEGEPVSGLPVAAAVAGAIAGEKDPAIPLGGAELFGLDGLSDRLEDKDLDRLILGGVTPVESLGGAVSVVRGVTTRTTTGEASDSTWRDLTTIRVVDDVIPGLRMALRTRFRRAKNTAQSRGAIRAQVVLELENKMAREIITGYQNVSVRADTEDATRCLVDFSFTVAHGLNQIWLTAHITV